MLSEREKAKWERDEWDNNNSVANISTSLSLAIAIWTINTHKEHGGTLPGEPNSLLH